MATGDFYGASNGNNNNTDLLCVKTVEVIVVLGPTLDRRLGRSVRLRQQRRLT